MQPLPIKPNSAGPTPAKPPALRYPADVAARMKATGVDPAAAEKRLLALPRDEAQTTWANVSDTYRHNTDLSSHVAAYQGADKSYQQQRLRQPSNPNWTAWDDMGSGFKNSLVGMAHGVADLVPSTVDLTMSAVSNPADDSWYRKWDDATDKYAKNASYYVSPEAQAAVWNEKTGLNWKAVAGMTGSTLGFLTTTMLPIIGQAGRVGRAAEGMSLGTKALRMLTDPRLQSGAIGYLQALPGYKESAIQAGYSRNQAALIAPILSTAQAVLEFAGADALIKGARIAPAEAMSVVRQLGKEAAADAFKNLAGKPLTEETFREVINATGRGFLGRLKTPEIRAAIWQNIKAGAASEGLEELTQQAAESAIQKMADTYYGYDAPGGKGFDPTLKQTLVQSVTGVLMGGIVGGSMGGMLGRTPTHVGQQTVWGTLDSNVRDLLSKRPDANLDEAKEGLSIYRLTDKLLDEGKLTQPEHQQARDGLDQMIGVSARLAKTGSDVPTRYALYNLDNQQRNWSNRIDSEVGQSLARLNQLADQDETGQYKAKADLYQPGRATDLFEANELINQNLPAKAALGQQIQQTINTAITGLSNSQTREQTLKSYRSTLDGLADQWDNAPAKQPDAPQRPDQYDEEDVPGLTHTMDTPDGRFALSDGPDGRQVLRVEAAVEGAQADVSEEADPAIGRFEKYNLPSKGSPKISLHTIADQTRHDQLLDAFDRHSDIAEPYRDWRSRLAEGSQDNQLDGLRRAEATYRKEASELPTDAPDWQKQDLARKRNWLKGAMASQASDPGESRYNNADWMGDYLAEPSRPQVSLNRSLPTFPRQCSNR